jgi:hypothetical protein
VGYVLWRSIWLVGFLLFWGCLWVLDKRLAMRLSKCWEYFWKRFLGIGDGLLTASKLNATCVVFNLLAVKIAKMR